MDRSLHNLSERGSIVLDSRIAWMDDPNLLLAQQNQMMSLIDQNSLPDEFRPRARSHEANLIQENRRVRSIQVLIVAARAMKHTE